MSKHSEQLKEKQGSELSNCDPETLKEKQIKDMWAERKEQKRNLYWENMNFKTFDTLITFQTPNGKLSAYGHNLVHFKRKYGKSGSMDLTINGAVKLLKSYNLKII